MDVNRLRGRSGRGSGVTAWQHADVPAPSLAFLARELVNMDVGLYSWVDIKRFAIEVDGSDDDLLAALLAHRQYRDTYAESDPAEQVEPFIHGPYWLCAIRPTTFQRTDPSSAREALQRWADDPEPPTPATQALLETKVFPLLSATVLYCLPDLRPDAQHEWGGVVGVFGFHEFVAVDRAARSLVLIVAADD
jgi:hypothetical protein